jgi:DNA-binding transcriptional ArsR family regulator
MLIETIRGGIYALAYKRIRESGPEGLPGLAPICTYISLAPFVDADEACVAANGDGRGRGPRESEELIRAVAEGPISHRVLSILSDRPASVAELADELGQKVEHLAPDLVELERAGLIESDDGGAGDDAAEHRYFSSKMGLVPETKWQQLSPEERHEISVAINHLIQADMDRALEAGSFDARTDRTLVRTPLIVDEQAWSELALAHIEFANRIFEIQAVSKVRLEKSEDEGIHARAILTLFEMPKGY